MFLEDYNTQQVVNLRISAPPGTKPVGNSAEWVVERPLLVTGSGNFFATLTNYISDYFSGCSATLNDLRTLYTPTSGSAVLVTMLDNNLLPISYPTVLGTNAIQFQNEGSIDYGYAWRPGNQPMSVELR